MAITSTDTPVEDASRETCTPGAAGQLIDPEEVELMASKLKAVADPMRLQMLHLIRQAPNGELCVCDLTNRLALSQPTVSHHLKILTTAGLLKRQRRGTWAWFSVVPDALRELQESLFPPAG
ncbi:ArsR/SmtB family transcription factor [Streptomyces sp. NPDC059176]|uniref:ArsR/SmtB family transcription factor n=1 Tax=unclassified Streptomyces TaxID=2593676 RepID=UPI00368F7401